MEVLIKRHNLLFLIAVRPRTEIYYYDYNIADCKNIIDFPFPNLKPLMKYVSLVVPKFGYSFLKKYTNANIIKSHLRHDFKYNKYVLVNDENKQKKDIVIWTINGIMHLENGPAFIQYGSSELNIIAYHYKYYDLTHREDGPAIFNNGTKIWAKYGKHHRKNGPAIIYADGEKRWYIFGKLHREKGPAIESDSISKWYIDNKLHNENGPAIIKITGPGQRSEKWYENGLLHRKNGPAVIEYLNNKVINKSYWENGQKIESNYYWVFCCIFLMFIAIMLPLILNV